VRIFISRMRTFAKLEAEISSHLQILRAGYGTGDDTEAVVVDCAGRGVGHPAATAAGVGKRHRVGQAERLAHQLGADAPASEAGFREV